MALAADLRILWKVLLPGTRGTDHAGRLEAFYGAQANDYDAYRRRLLHGREEMMAALPIQQGDRLLDLGGGTGSNLEALGERRQLLRSATVVDLSPSLLGIARERIARNEWDNVAAVQADATTYEPPDGPVDLVTFSYSLTMIPDWFLALDRALANLKPGGAIGVVDFYVARKWPAEGMRRHSRFQRTWWPAMFGWDNVFLSPDHLPYLRERFEKLKLEERTGRMPYMLGLKAPYYMFVGKKRPV
jgi:S-adenosylmethionine-diacylgycerolhomoserine-N-methlytransferase